MSRLTKKDTYINNLTIKKKDLFDCYDKLENIEDLMEEYEIKSIEELENLLASKVIAGGMRRGGKSIVGKGMLYNILSEELGCPLYIVFKALKEGKIYFENGTYSTDFVLQRTPAWAFAIYDNLINNKEIVIIKDYGKTWWLKGEKNE